MGTYPGRLLTRWVGAGGSAPPARMRSTYCALTEQAPCGVLFYYIHKQGFNALTLMCPTKRGHRAYVYIYK
jgi:hypothetical protein